MHSSTVCTLINYLFVPIVILQSTEYWVLYSTVCYISKPLLYNSSLYYYYTVCVLIKSTVINTEILKLNISSFYEYYENKNKTLRS